MKNSYLIPLDKLNPSPTNPRKNFVDETIKELAENMKSVGQIENIIVRENLPDKGGYEIVCGERRYRAAKLAGIENLACDVRILNDDEVLEIQISENLGIYIQSGTRKIKKYSGVWTIPRNYQ